MPFHAAPHRFLPALLAVLATVAPARPQDSVPAPGGPAGAPSGPIPAGDRLEFPEGSAVPRSLTPEEEVFLRDHPLQRLRAMTPPPGGPLHAVAEYEPMEAIMIAWEGPGSFRTILTQMGAEITTTGNADLIVVVDDAADQAQAQTQLAAGGVDMNRVRWFERATDTIWIRDYGPRYAYEGDCRVVVDHVYNRPRPNDDVLPSFWASARNQSYYEHVLVHGGGNYHLDAVGEAWASRLIANENPGMTEAEIVGTWRDYLGVETELKDPYPQSVDSTQHIDMWMIPVGDRSVLVSDWPFNPGSLQDSICDTAATRFLAAGWTVGRLPARSIAGVHYTYTNAVLVNDLALVPSYSNAAMASHNAEALAAWQTAVPGKTVVQIPSEAIVSSAGVLHCIAMHVPLARGSGNPTAWLRGPRGCLSLVPGSVYDIRWISDDDRGTVSADILLSTDGGGSFPVSVASGIPDSGTFSWTVPDLPTARARIRVVVRDSDGNAGAAESPQDFAIGPPGTGAPPEPGLLLADKVVPGEDVTWTFATSPGALAYNVYEGPLGVYYGVATGFCARRAGDPGCRDNGDGTVSYTLTPAAGSRWYLASASNCTAESPLVLPPPAWLCGPTP